MKKNNVLIIFGIISVLLITSCKTDEPATPVVPNEEEVITTLTYTLTPEGGGTPVVLKFKDADGDGPTKSEYTISPLTANTTYSGSIELLNETTNPAEDVTEEVKKEALEHQLFFAPSTGITIAYNDKDSNNKPIGLKSTLTTTNAGAGTIKVTLRHKPNKSATGVSEGNITNAGGETDIEVTFNVTVE